MRNVPQDNSGPIRFPPMHKEKSHKCALIMEKKFSAQWRHLEMYREKDEHDSRLLFGLRTCP